MIGVQFTVQQMVLLYNKRTLGCSSDAVSFHLASTIEALVCMFLSTTRRQNRTCSLPSHFQRVQLDRKFETPSKASIPILHYRRFRLNQRQPARCNRTADMLTWMNDSHLVHPTLAD